MGGEQGSAFDLIGQMVDHRMRDGGAVKGGSPAPQLVQDHEGAMGGVAEHLRMGRRRRSAYVVKTRIHKEKNQVQDRLHTVNSSIEGEELPH